MAKLKSTPITENDLNEFLASESDFAFEMTVLSLLRKIGFNSLHSGTYQDPVTKKIRQFDLRAGKNEGDFLLTLAGECKNLGVNFPLLITAVPRTIDEAFHEGRCMWLTKWWENVQTKLAEQSRMPNS